MHRSPVQVNNAERGRFRFREIQANASLSERVGAILGHFNGLWQVARHSAARPAMVWVAPVHVTLDFGNAIGQKQALAQQKEVRGASASERKGFGPGLYQAAAIAGSREKDQNDPVSWLAPFEGPSIHIGAKRQGQLEADDGLVCPYFKLKRLSWFSS